ncbi:hypothetical protein D7Y27_22020 [Corallococcus sp. AB004]|nr:hypothetical protein D7Y27_22020 [Corallococcus sp. AB004]
MTRKSCIRVSGRSLGLYGALLSTLLLLSATLVSSVVFAANPSEPPPEEVSGCPDCPPPPECEPEVCDGVDNDCDGKIDEGLLRTLYRDADGDGYGAGASIQGCPLGLGWVTNNLDCNDSNASVWQVARFYRDADGDGYGAPNNWIDSCGRPAGYVTNATDCNDSNAAVKPGAIKQCGVGACAASVQACVNGVERTCTPGPSSPEVCDREDNDCNGKVDDVPPITCGQGVCMRSAPACGELCETVEGQDGKPPKVICEWGNYGRCTPGTPSKELCANGLDDDCNGSVDDASDQADWITFYPDRDHDGVGASWGAELTCQQPPNTSRVSGDCDDTRSDMKPGAAELCDGIDNNCSGDVDESGVCEQSVCQ